MCCFILFGYWVRGGGVRLCEACFKPSLCVFHRSLGFFPGGGGVPRGPGYNLLMQFSSHSQQLKNGNFQNRFFLVF